MLLSQTTSIETSNSLWQMQIRTKMINFILKAINPKKNNNKKHLIILILHDDNTSFKLIMSKYYTTYNINDFSFQNSMMKQHKSFANKSVITTVHLINLYTNQ